MKWLAMTRVFRLGSILKFAVPAAVALMAAAFLAGQQWQSGRQAQETLRVAERQQDDRARLVEHRQQVATDYEARRSERAVSSRITDAQLRAFFDARPGLWDCDVGDDGLRLIRSWDAAGGTTDSPESVGPVSDAAAGAGHRPAPGSDGEQEGEN